MKRIYRIISVVVFAVCAMLVQGMADSTATTQTKPGIADTSITTQTLPIRRVLIASGGSRLEKVVVKNLTDLLRNKDCDITIIDIDDVQKMNPDSFGATVLLNAVDKSSLKPEIQTFIDSYEKDLAEIGKTTVIVSMISGEQWKNKESEVDAIAQASTAVKPKNIAMKLYKKIAAKLDLK
jgi:menaquinone-dependent protoporphyrinogen IX oxidase